MSPFLQQILGSVLRSLLKAAFGWLTMRGFIEADQGEALVAGLVGLILSIAWSGWVKFRDRQKLVTALAVPRAATEATIERMVKAGEAPSVLTSRTELPHVS